LSAKIGKIAESTKFFGQKSGTFRDLSKEEATKSYTIRLQRK
jgi:hypothetical protein